MKFYYDKTKQFWGGGQHKYCIGVDGEKSFYFYLQQIGKEEHFGRVECNIRGGYWIEVQDWPEYVSNPELLAIIKPAPPSMKERLQAAAIRVNNQEEFHLLKGLYLGADFDVNMSWTLYSGCWFINDDNFTCYASSIAIYKDKVIYNSVDDFLNNKPAPKDVRKEICGCEVTLTKDGVKIDNVFFYYNHFREIAEFVKKGMD